MKISKTSWIILGAGLFIIVLAGLGMTRAGQMKEKDRITQELLVVQARLNNLQIAPLQAQINEYNEQLNNAKSQAAEIKLRLKQTVISVDVADKFYEIADFYGVAIDTISTSSISAQTFASINCETISLSAVVSGELSEIVDFVTGLNNNFTTGFVKSTQLSIGEDEHTSVSLQMIVYSQKEK